MQREGLRGLELANEYREKLFGCSFAYLHAAAWFASAAILDEQAEHGAVATMFPLVPLIPPRSSAFTAHVLEAYFEGTLPNRNLDSLHCYVNYPAPVCIV
jgi:hypothetical protein